jgi:hypothetical protein
MKIDGQEYPMFWLPLTLENLREFVISLDRVSPADVMTEFGCSAPTARRYLLKLVDMGVVKVEGATKSRRYIYVGKPPVEHPTHKRRAEPTPSRQHHGVKSVTYAGRKKGDNGSTLSKNRKDKQAGRKFQSTKKKGHK